MSTLISKSRLLARLAGDGLSSAGNVISTGLDPSVISALPLDSNQIISIINSSSGSSVDSAQISVIVDQLSLDSNETIALIQTIVDADYVSDRQTQGTADTIVSLVRVTDFEFIASQGQTIFSGIDNSNNVLSYTAGNVLVHRNGILLTESIDYIASNGTSIVLADPASSNDLLTINAFSGTQDSLLTSEILEIVDSAYVQSRQIISSGSSSGIDSNAIIDLIDSAYVQSRQTVSSGSSSGIDSSAVLNLVNNQGYVSLPFDISEFTNDAGYITSSETDSSAILSLINSTVDSSYVQSRQDFLYSSLDNKPNILDSTAVNELISTAISNAITINVYSDASLLPIQNVTVGAQALVQDKLYIYNGSGWYNLQLLNTDPVLQTFVSNGSPYELEDGVPLSLTLTAIDNDDTPIIWSAETSDFGNAHVNITNDSNGAFTIQNKTRQEIINSGYSGNGGTFTIFFKASDGINFDADSAVFTLDLEIITPLISYTSTNSYTESVNGRDISVDGNVLVSFDDSSESVSIYKSSDDWATSGNITFEQTITSPVSGGNFGQSASISGNTLVVSAPSSNQGGVDGSSNEGSVHVYIRSNSSGSFFSMEYQRIVPSLINETFSGNQVLIDHDDNTLFISGQNYSGGQPGSGAVWVYRRTSATGEFNQSQRIETDPVEYEGQLGNSLDYDSLTKTVIIGARGQDFDLDNTQSLGKGSVRILTRNETDFQNNILRFDNQAIIRAPYEEDNSFFGHQVAISGNTAIASKMTSVGKNTLMYSIQKDNGVWSIGNNVDFTLCPDSFATSLLANGVENIDIDSDRDLLTVGLPGFESGAMLIFTRASSGGQFSYSTAIKSNSLSSTGNFGSGNVVYDTKLITVHDITGGQNVEVITSGV